MGLTKRRAEITSIMNNYETELREKHPVKSRTKHWRRPMARQHREELNSELDREIEVTKEENLEPWVKPLYEVKAKFDMKVQELTDKADVIKTPMFTIKHKIMIWNP